MNLFYRFGVWLAEIGMAIKWVFCDTYGHDETFEELVMTATDPIRYDVHERCHRCWRYVA